MITLLGSLLGFISSMFPDLLKLFRDAQDRKHEITILQMQMEQQKLGASQRLEEIQVNADIAESSALYKTYTTGIGWVDALNGTVRPVIAAFDIFTVPPVSVFHVTLAIVRAAATAPLKFAARLRASLAYSRAICTRPLSLADT